MFKIQILGSVQVDQEKELSFWTVRFGIQLQVRLNVFEAGRAHLSKMNVVWEIYSQYKFTRAMQQYSKL